MRKTVVLTLIFSLVQASLVFAGKDELPSGTAFNKMILPSSAAMVGELVKTTDAKFLSANISETAPQSMYGFSTAVSEEQGSFKLGIVLADLKVYLQAGEREQVIKSLSTLAATMVELGAPVPMISSVVNLNSAVKEGTDLAAINQAGLAVLTPFIEAFVEKEGKTVFMRFGEWSETTRLAAVAGQEGKSQVIVAILQGINPAAYFLTELKDQGLPAGAAASLNILADLGTATELGKREIRKALKEINNVIQMMG